ncbi:tol-pal system protein YbgF [Faunimonas pinastri]|uniref:Cell division coordinator CpoB n=1 Tax=Faunimonas pinastri TaxID=1855383 RepID=A0A1H8Z7Y6_9HYPH|nr:tol-pal system protein YbgF [Faunimonas pinastri]SEP60451.1 tol-pal system protein YbgF [Faunimonas pinastri]
MSTRLLTASLLALTFASPALAQSAQQQIGQMQLYIQQLEEQNRQLTGQVDELTHQIGILQQQLAQGAPAQAVPGATPPGAMASAVPPTAAPNPAAMPQTNVSPPIGPVGSAAGDNAPLDLSALASGAAPGAAPAFGAPAGDGNPAAPASVSPATTPREQYDQAYGYILSGDYDLAQRGFKRWLQANPNDPQANDARFWLGESYFQLNDPRDAASTFLAVYKAAPRSPKAPDALVKLGMSLSALGEKEAACATLGEVGRKFPEASAAVKTRVNEETHKAGC